MKTTVDDVRAFWNAGPCQSKLSLAEERLQYFQEISDKRYGILLNGLRAEQSATIRCRSGGRIYLRSDVALPPMVWNLQRNGANYVGVDLTPKSIELAKERFGLFGVPGRFEVANAGKKNYRLPITVLIMSTALV